MYGPWGVQGDSYLEKLKLISHKIRFFIPEAFALIPSYVVLTFSPTDRHASRVDIHSKRSFTLIVNYISMFWECGGSCKLSFSWKS